MKTCIVIPMKDPQQSKQRLSPVLNQAQRQTLALTLFRQTLRFLGRHFPATPVLVVSASDRVAAIATEYGAQSLKEPEACGLNGAATLAARWSREQGFDSQLLLPADIAELSEVEIRRLLDHPREKPSLVICPADDGGTNALLSTPPDVVPFLFGQRSSRAHLAAALQRGIPCALLQMDKLSFDLDSPDDLQHWTESLARPAVVAECEPPSSTHLASSHLASTHLASSHVASLPFDTQTDDRGLPCSRV